jgi:hypothetical protein
MTDHEAQPDWVNKIDVAEHQLCGAIRFFFERRDPIIVHALIETPTMVALCSEHSVVC